MITIIEPFHCQTTPTDLSSCCSLLFLLQSALSSPCCRGVMEEKKHLRFDLRGETEVHCIVIWVNFSNHLWMLFRPDMNRLDYSLVFHTSTFSFYYSQPVLQLLQIKCQKVHHLACFCVLRWWYGMVLFYIFPIEKSPKKVPMANWLVPYTTDPLPLV